MPGEHPWGGHEALRTEDGTRLDLHPLYLSLGEDWPSRRRVYQGLLAQDAGREAVPLAGRYFVGRRRFARRMERKLGLAGPGARVEWEEVGSGLVSVRPKHGGSSEPDWHDAPQVPICSHLPSSQDAWHEWREVLTATLGKAGRPVEKEEVRLFMIQRS